MQLLGNGSTKFVYHFVRNLKKVPKRPWWFHVKYTPHHSLGLTETLFFLFDSIIYLTSGVLTKLMVPLKSIVSPTAMMLTRCFYGKTTHFVFTDLPVPSISHAMFSFVRAPMSLMCVRGVVWTPGGERREILIGSKEAPVAWRLHIPVNMSTMMLLTLSLWICM